MCSREGCDCDSAGLDDLELKMVDGRVEVWRLVHRVLCPIHDRELDTTGCLACKAAATNL